MSLTAARSEGASDQSGQPLRLGRHCNSALAAWRRTRAVELATQGLTYQAIADELGYASRGTVHRIVRQALESRLTDGVEVLREVEVDRLNALQAGLWEAAMSGDAAAATACVKIVQTRSRILGLFEGSAKKSGNTDAVAGRSVVLAAR